MTDNPAMSPQSQEIQNHPKDEQGKTLKRVVVSSFLGNFIEWFDYASYSYFATVIALVFMPQGDPTVALLETFAVFALSFLMRPVGAVFWGNMGDKKGRKWALTASILLMSGATFLIGCLPTYAMVGLLAPVLLLLLRMVQSFSASGEYAGAATFLAEYAPANKRGLYCSVVPASTATGLLCGSMFATVMYAVCGHDSAFVTEWGWRIPFLLAGPLGLITHYMREHLSDSPVYAKMQADLDKKKGGQKSAPFMHLVKKYPRVLLISFGACMLNAVGFYALTVPAFYLLNSQDFLIILVVELAMCFLLTINDGTLSSYLTETFPTDVRYSGFALSFNLANALFGGSASFISIALIEATGNAIAPAWYMVVISAIALVAMIMSHEHSGKDLSEIE